MTGRESSPPGLALWLLRQMCPGQHGEALVGDLIERFREGQTRGWFWKQAFVASALSALGSLRRRWPLFCYAIAATIGMIRFSHTRALTQVPFSLHWSRLPWPWSQLVFELSSPVIVASMGLLILAIGLVIARSFRWASLLRTWIINLALILIAHYSTDYLPWLLRPVPGSPCCRVLIVPGAVQILLIVSGFLIAAWLGCPMKEHEGMLIR